MPATKEELAKGRVALRAKEEAIKREWCALEGHRWDLPGANPFNHDMLECELICNRCNAHADLKVFVRPEPPSETKPEGKANEAAQAQAKR